jgi:mercuric reductase
MKVDLAIIGGGGAAFGAALKAEELGLKTVLVHQEDLGGTSLHHGCMPSKFLLEAAWDCWLAGHPRYSSLPPRSPVLDWPALLREKQAMIAHNARLRYQEVLAACPHVRVLNEKAWFEGPGWLRTSSGRIEARATVIATGCSPRSLDLPGTDALQSVLCGPAQAFDFNRLPESLLVLGGGATGLEVAQCFAHFGTWVTLLQSRSRILPAAELEISEALEKRLRTEGIEVVTSVRAKKLGLENGKPVLWADCGMRERKFQAEKIFVAIGMRGRTESLNLAAIGVACDANGYIVVDEQLRTAAPRVYAAGDVAGPPLLEPVAAREGALAVSNAFEEAGASLDYEGIPTAVFTEPQAALVGLTETEALGRGLLCETRVVDLASVTKADLGQRREGLAKLVVEKDGRKLLGFQALAPQAAEFIHEAALAIQQRLTVDDITRLVHVFPTYGEIFRLSALAFKMDVKRMACCPA